MYLLFFILIVFGTFQGILSNPSSSSSASSFPTDPSSSPSTIVPLRPAREIDNERLFTLRADEFFATSVPSDATDVGKPYTIIGYGSTLFRLRRSFSFDTTEKEEYYQVLTYTRQWLRRRTIERTLTDSSLSLINLNSADIVYTDNGNTISSITIVRSIDDNTTETSTEWPIFGRMYWITYRENYTVTDTTERTVESTVYLHKLVINTGIPRNELSVYRHSYTIQECTKSLLPPESVDDIPADNEEEDGEESTPSDEESVEVGTDGTLTVPPSPQPSVAASSKTASLPSPTVSASPSPSVPFSLRVMTYNVWNSNPPKWLWRDPRDRFRQYALRLFTLADTIRLVQPDIIALQEVRYDSSLGTFDNNDYTPEQNYAYPSRYPDANTTAALEAYWTEVDNEILRYDPRYDNPPVIDRSVPYDLKLAYGVASLWYNRTCSFAENPRYINRNIPKWNAITQSNGWNTYGTGHYLEGIEAGKQAELRKQREAAAALAAMDPHELEERTLFSTPTPPPPPPPPGYSPYSNKLPRGPPSFSRIQRSMLMHPHSQMEHLSSFFPEYQFVYTPGQLYFDKNDWMNAHSRDEEGPAIMSKYPIVEANYILLSRNTTDEGDGHQRLCLHAIIDVSSALGLNSSTYLVDVYTIHLSLSEIARNRTVLELESYIHHSAKGKIAILTGDMNAEPHEPAMQRLQGLPITLQQSSGESTETVGTNGPSPILLRDAWLHKYPEPVPRDNDPGVRRYGFTFPSDDPVKRIDLMYIGYPSTEIKSNGTVSSTVTPFCAGTEEASNDNCIIINEVYVVGQDALPGTEATEGHGHGMVSERSPIYGSDHRGVVTHLTLPRTI